MKSPALAATRQDLQRVATHIDFLTWFEFAPADAGAFDELVGRLRQSEEWSYVDREVDVRLTRLSDRV